MRSPLLDRPGAVPSTAADSPDAEVAWHYGDPMREQRLLAAGDAVTDLSHRGLVVVTGEDRLTWLHSLTTQHLSELPAGLSVESLVLSPHGHVEHALHLSDDSERTWISVEATSMRAADGVEPVVDWLRGMRFRTRVAVEDVTADWAALGVVLAPGQPLPARWAALAAAAEAASPPSWQDPWPAPGPDTGVYTTGDPAEHPGWRRPWREVWVRRESLPEALDGVSLAGSWAAEALRVAAWRPRCGCENDHRMLPHEADWLRTALHLTKGCYRGQETVARVHHLGRPPRRLVMLHLDGSEHEIPAAGDEVYLGERAVGTVRTAVRHHELGPVALALLKRTVPVEAPLVVAGIAAAQEIVVAP